MSSAQKQQLVAVQYRVPPELRAWLATEAAAQQRSINWLAIKILGDAMSAANANVQQPTKSRLRGARSPKVFVDSGRRTL